MDNIRTPLVIAHRGNSGFSPENTLVAFQQAIDLGADMIEIDVHLSADGVPVVIHDETINRTSNGKGLVSKHNLHDLQKYDAGSWFSEEFRSEKIPSLEEVLNLVSSKCKLLIEIKFGSGKYPGIEKRVLDLIIKYKAQDWCVVQSFNTEVVQILRKLHAPIGIHKLVTGNIPLLPFHIDYKLQPGKIYQYKNASGINPNYKFVNKNVVAKIHALNKTIYSWTVNSESGMKKMIAAGVDGIITNFPEKLKALL